MDGRAKLAADAVLAEVIKSQLEQALQRGPARVPGPAARAGAPEVAPAGPGGRARRE